jgi:Na+-driven multidrug efflux pump
LLASVLVLALLNAWWIPLYGLSGAAWAALSAELIQAGVLLVHYLYQPRPKLAVSNTNPVA